MFISQNTFLNITVKTIILITKIIQNVRHISIIVNGILFCFYFTFLYDVYFQCHCAKSTSHDKLLSFQFQRNVWVSKFSYSWVSASPQTLKQYWFKDRMMWLENSLEKQALSKLLSVFLSSLEFVIQPPEHRCHVKRYFVILRYVLRITNIFLIFLTFFLSLSLNILFLILSLRTDLRLSLGSVIPQSLTRQYWLSNVRVLRRVSP